MATTTKGTARVSLPTDDTIQIDREFAAPRELVFRAYTTPELVSRWWHADHGVMKSCDIDLQVGGSWRYAMTAHGGQEVAFHGEYLEIVPDERLVYSEVYEGAPEAPGHTTVTFSDIANGTAIKIVSRYQTSAIRDAVLESGMESGMQTALDLLEQVAATAV